MTISMTRIDRLPVAAVCVSIAAVFLATSLIWPAKAHAASSNIKTLQAGKSVSANLNDEKKRTILYAKQDEGEGWTLTISVDGEQKLSLSRDNDICYPEVKLLTVGKNTKLLYLAVFATDLIVDSVKIYRYTGSAFAEVGDLKEQTFGAVKPQNSFRAPIVKKVSKNKISLRWTAANTVVGNHYFTVTYNYRKKKLKNATDIYMVKNIFKAPSGKDKRKYWKGNWGTANKSFKLYKTPGSKKVAFKAKSGMKLKVSEIMVYKKTIYYYTWSKSGKTGWIKNPKKSAFWFKEAQGAA